MYNRYPDHKTLLRAAKQYRKMNEFDSKAQGWDDNPVHLARSLAIAEKLAEMIPLGKGMEALEFGAGTGLLSLLLKDRFDSVTMLDSSREMVRIMREKLYSQEIRHMNALLFDLEKDDLEGSFDVIYSQMVFHHVMDPVRMLEKFFRLLKPGGFLAIADLYTEDGTFHDEPFTGHHGFDPDQLARQAARCGFTEIRHQTCFVIRKNRKITGTREYPVFLLRAQKI